MTETLDTTTVKKTAASKAPAWTMPSKTSSGFPITKGLEALLLKLKTYLVDWDHHPHYEPTRDRGERTMGEANVVSSQLKDSNLHVVAIDLDVTAYLVPSSTPGNSHLYIVHPMEWSTYKELLKALAKAGVIESRYASVSITRGHTALRLPWVSKQRVQPHPRPIPTRHPLDDER